MDNNSANDRIGARLYSGGLNIQSVVGGSATVNIADVINPPVVGEEFCLAMKCAANDFAYAINGGAAVPDVTHTVPPLDGRIRVGYRAAGDLTMDEFACSQLFYVPVAPSNGDVTIYSKPVQP